MNKLNRREFLKNTGLLGAAGMVQPLALSLAGMSEAVAATNADYKALVCVFLLGGNDAFNTVIATDPTNLSIYQQYRGSVALNPAQLLPLTPTGRLLHGTQYALHPNLPKLQQLFNQNKHLAILQNVGTLKKPTTKEEYRMKQNLPPKLFSHNDQQSYWQSHSMSKDLAEGWGGKIGRLMQGGNTPRNQLLTCISTDGKHKFLTTGTTQQYSIGRKGAQKMNPVYMGSIMNSVAISTEIRNMMSANRSNIFEKELTTVFNRSYATEKTVTAAIGENSSLQTVFAQDPLSEQMHIVARLIKAQSQLGMRRQVFFVTLGGFDTHDRQLDRHVKLLSHVDNALGSFYEALREIGMLNNVTTFTASDFGRTFVNNGDGTDHGWGAHHFIMGGAVKGGEYYGITPHYGHDTSDDVGQGRLIPTTSVDQYAATLARWFGIPDNHMPSFLPNIGNFAERYLDFI